MAAATDSSNLVSDEEFARRLQQEEFRSMLPNAFQNFGAPRVSANSNNSNDASSQDINAPLLHDAAANPLLNDGVGVAQQANPNNVNAAQRARRNVIGHVRDADTDSPRILLLRITIALLEVVATATVLAIGWNEGASTSCNYLKYWALVYSARHLVTIPLRIHIYRTNRQPEPQPQPAQNAQNAQNGDGAQNAQNDVNVNGGQDMAGPIPRATAEKSIQVLRWLSIMTFLLFLLGQTFLFTEKTCQDTAPTVWYYCLVIIILVYVSLALPFLIVLAICICLPCVLIIFRFFAEPEGADDRMIKNLPTRKITAADLRAKESGGGGPGGDGKEDEEEVESTGDTPSCAICMQDYKENDELRILPCGHEFHCECVDKWLPMKKICPLCRHDVTKQVSTAPDSPAQAQAQAQVQGQAQQGQVNIDMDGRAMQ